MRGKRGSSKSCVSASAAEENMSGKYYDLVQSLSRVGVVFEPGLSSSEIASAQEKAGLQFPPDLVEFLREALPVEESSDNVKAGSRFPNWRSDGDVLLRDGVQRPIDGILYDVRENDFWFSEWRARPRDVEAAVAVAREELAGVPKLIPLFSHRYLPETPREVGNPVFSVSQTDVIYFGVDLADYFENEFLRKQRRLGPPVRQIPFWGALASQ